MRGSAPVLSQTQVDGRDEMLMRLNLFGLRGDVGHGRARMDVRLAGDTDRDWHLILATGRPDSPFDLVGDTIVAADGAEVARIRLVEHDDARLGYARDGGRVLTANTNRRSTCTGCVFCPNTLAGASDPRMSTDGALAAWLEGVLIEQGWSDFSHVRQVNLSTGCFGTEERALSHLESLRNVLTTASFTGRLGILTSVIRSREAMTRLADTGPFALFVTLECLTRRALLLKESKAELTTDEAHRVLERAREAGVDTGVMLVVGLDPIDAVGAWLDEAAPLLTDFPNLQIFQAHTPYMAMFRESGAERLGFFLQARTRFERSLRGSGLQPEPWANFRPLWYYQYDGRVRVLADA